LTLRIRVITVRVDGCGFGRISTAVDLGPYPPHDWKIAHVNADPSSLLHQKHKSYVNPSLSYVNPSSGKLSRVRIRGRIHLNP